MNQQDPRWDEPKRDDPKRDDPAQDGHQASQPRRKASIGQVAATMFWALFMIGKKGTWERNGVTISMAQAVVGGIIMCVVVVFLLILLTRLAVA